MSSCTKISNSKIKPGVPEDNFAIRWSGILHAKESGHMNFRICANDGYRLFIDDKEIISDWKDHGITRGDAVYQVEKGRDYKMARGMATFCPVFVTVDLQHLPQKPYIEGRANSRLRFGVFS